MPSVDVNAPPAPPVSRSTRRLDLTLLFILLFGILLRCQYLDLPMAEAHRWREITNADIARNFAERSMNIFYPQVNWGGAHDPYVGMEFPLMHWIAALFYLILGEHAIIGRLISMAFSVATIWAVFALGARLFGVAAGRAAAFLMAISPNAVFFGRFFISDTPMVFYSVLAVLGWVAYLQTRSTAWWVTATVSAALAFLVKIPAVMILAPIAWAAWEARGWAALRDPGLVAGLTAALVAAGLWYWHADVIYHTTGLSQAIWHPSGNYPSPIADAAGPFIGIYHWSNMAQLTDPGFYEEMVTRAWALHLTPAGFILGLFALVAMWRRPHRQIVDAWIAVMLLFILVTAEGNRHHEFHQLPLIPPAALLFGLAAAPAFDGRWLRENGGRVTGVLGSAAALVVLALLSFKYSGVVENLFRPRGLDMAPIEAGRALRGAVDPDDLLVTVEYEQYGNNSPILLYWANRRGWSFDLSSITPQVIELLHRQYGARYFVTTVWSRLAETHPEVVEFLRTRRQIPLRSAPPNTALFDLSKEPVPDLR